MWKSCYSNDSRYRYGLTLFDRDYWWYDDIKFLNKRGSLYDDIIGQDNLVGWLIWSRSVGLKKMDKISSLKERYDFMNYYFNVIYPARLKKMKSETEIFFNFYMGEI